MAYVSQEKKSQLAPAIKAVLKKYNMKASISVRHHSSLVVTVKQGPIDFGKDDYIQVNTYWINDHYEGKARDFLNELKAAMEGPDFFNEDDAMTDYFHRSHYVDINIGKWDKPYALAA
jgi:hypothetical protein